MKLIELKIRHPAAGAPGHGDTVAAGSIRVAGIEIGLARSTRGQYHAAGLEQVDPAAALVEDVGALAASTGCHQVHRHPVGEPSMVRWNSR
jgi:hypothetical protein